MTRVFSAVDSGAIFKPGRLPVRICILKSGHIMLTEWFEGDKKTLRDNE